MLTKTIDLVASERLSFHRRRRRILVNALHFGNDGLQATLLLMPSLMVGGNLALTPLSFGVLGATHHMVCVAVGTPAGRLTRRRDGLWMLPIAVLLDGVCLGSLATASSIGSIAVIFLLSGVGYGVFHPIGLTVLTEASEPQERGRALGTFAAVGDIGRLVLPQTTMGIALWMGWRGASVVGAVMAIAVAAGSLFACRAWGALESESSPTGAAASRKSARQVFAQNQGFSAACGIGFLDALSGSSVYIFLPLLFTSRGVADPRVPLALFFGASLFGKVISGRLSDRFGTRSSLAILKSCNVAAFVCVCVVRDPAMLCALVVLLGALTKGTVPIVLSLASERLRPSDLSTGFGVNQSVSAIATPLSPLLMGLVSHAFGVEAAFIALGVVCALTVVIVMTLQPPTHHGSTP